MNTKLVECVPNFSEGRDEKKIQEIVNAIVSAKAIALDVEKDPDHNRSVITFIADLDHAVEAAFKGVQKAAKLIDLNHHKGEHPRMGAADVVPFIPIGETTMEDCIQLAKELGEKIGKELQIPVFLYDRAAARPERRDLANVRKGQFEGLRGEIGKNPDKTPDFGPNRIHPTAGAVAVGAREQIINFNINLKTRDLEIGKAIAKKIRTSGGGLPYLRAKEIDLAQKGLVQVSTVLTNDRVTSLHRVLSEVEKETASHHVEIAGTEIVGLVSGAALTNFAEKRLNLDGFNPETQILENQFKASALVFWPEAAHRAIEAVAAPTATPGGGSVSALAGAFGSALGRMVCGISLAKSANPQIQNLLEELNRLGTDLEMAARRDTEAFDQVMRAFKKSKTDPERPQTIQSAFKHAAEVPLQTARLSRELLQKLKQLESLTDPNTVSDVKTAQYLSQAAIRGAMENVQINLGSIKDPAFVQSAKKQADEILEGL